MGCSSVLTFQLDSPAEALALFSALSPEAADALPKARASVAQEGDATIVVRVEAVDAPSLRAGVNSYLRWAKAALDAARIGAR